MLKKVMMVIVRDLNLYVKRREKLERDIFTREIKYYCIKVFSLQKILHYKHTHTLSLSCALTPTLFFVYYYSYYQYKFAAIRIELISIGFKISC